MRKMEGKQEEKMAELSNETEDLKNELKLVQNRANQQAEEIRNLSSEKMTLEGRVDEQMEEIEKLEDRVRRKVAKYYDLQEDLDVNNNKIIE